MSNSTFTFRSSPFNHVTVTLQQNASASSLVNSLDFLSVSFSGVFHRKQPCVKESMRHVEIELDRQYLPLGFSAYHNFAQNIGAIWI